jgi:hypothetical protein
LKEEPSARVEIPSVEEIIDYQEVVSSQFPVLNGTWCAVDGLKIPIQKSGDEEIQNAYYNGWLQSHFVGCIFVFTPSGLIVLLKMEVYMINYELFMSVLVELQ